MSKKEVLAALEALRVRGLTEFQVDVLMFYLQKRENYQVSPDEWNAQALKMKGSWLSAGDDIDVLVENNLLEVAEGGMKVTRRLLVQLGLEK